jgi:CRISPR-associated exonuclease Cas4
MIMDFRTAFQEGLEKALNKQAETELGDRTQYIGSSDIGNCPRMSVLRKIKPRQQSLESLIRMVKGHLTEDIVAMAFKGYNPKRQAGFVTTIQYCPCGYAEINASEVSCPRCDGELSEVPLKAHIDFLFGNKILETKSSNYSDMFASWEMQLYFQLMVSEMAGGALLSISLADGSHNLSNGYKPDHSMFNMVMDRAILVWKELQLALKSDDPLDLALTTEPGFLCSVCDYLGSCPAFKGEVLPERLMDAFQQFFEVKEEVKAKEKERELLKKDLEKIISLGSYELGNFRINLSERKRGNVNTNAVLTRLEELGEKTDGFKSDTYYKVLDVRKAKK